MTTAKMTIEERARDVVDRWNTGTGSWRASTDKASQELTDSILKALQEVRAGGLEKAAEICRYWADAPLRNEASKATCRDIEISCLATAERIRRGEYENPTSDVMALKSQGDGGC